MQPFFVFLKAKSKPHPLKKGLEGKTMVNLKKTHNLGHYFKNIEK